jgi:very-short-patch-repair endonuclease
VNVWLPLPGGEDFTADFVWRRYGLVVETDGRRYHATRAGFERDRRRDQALVLAGRRVVRFTWRQVFCEAGQVAATVLALLEQTRRRRA